MGDLKNDEEDVKDAIFKPTTELQHLIGNSSNFYSFCAKDVATAGASGSAPEHLEQELISLTGHFDRRVRTASVKALEQICEARTSATEGWGGAGRCLDIGNYHHLAELCKNSEQNVRIVALRIVARYAGISPEEKVTSAKGFQIRLQDDAFSIVCNAMNDLEMNVRAEAAKLLGTFSLVSDSFLHQTLDKKLMRNMTMMSEGVKTGQFGASGGHVGGWSSGKKMAEETPADKQDEESQSLIPTGACGAFVTALEDEFMAVRQAAVYSLGTLARNRPAFATACIDHLADMFNDEIQQIRLDAIRALTPLISHGTLHRDQLDTVLTVVDDATADNRMALHELLAKSNLSDSQCVMQCLNKLLHSLRRFPLDKFSIYRCLSAIGKRHAEMVQALVDELLDIHPIFDTPEQNVDDDFYLAKLIVVLNAASQNSVICSTVPTYARKHYRFLLRTWPNLIPKISTFDEKERFGLGSLPTIPVICEDIEKWADQEAVKTVRVLEPSREFQANEVVKFVAGLPIGISVRLMLENVSDAELRDFRIQVEYPDQTFDFHRPRRNDFLRLNERTVHLQTHVVVSAQRWATPAAVTFTPGIVRNSAGGGFLPERSATKGLLKKPTTDGQQQNQQQIAPLPSADNPARRCKLSINIHPIQQA